MLWSAPKTDWEIKPYVNGIFQGDWFNVADYTHLANAIRFLHYYGQSIYGVTFSISNMPDVTLNNFIRPAEINLLEDNVYALTQNLYNPPTYTGKTTWVGNGTTPDFDDFNRMGQACVNVYGETAGAILYANFIPSGADSLITADGDTFCVRALTDDYGLVTENVTVSADYGLVNESVTTKYIYGGL